MQHNTGHKNTENKYRLQDHLEKLAYPYQCLLIQNLKKNEKKRGKKKLMVQI